MFTASTKPTFYVCDTSLKLISLNFGNDGQKMTAMLLFAYCAQLAEEKQKPLRESTLFTVDKSISWLHKNTSALGTGSTEKQKNYCFSGH